MAQPGRTTRFARLNSNIVPFDVQSASSSFLPPVLGAAGTEINCAAKPVKNYLADAAHFCCDELAPGRVHVGLAPANWPQPVGGCRIRRVRAKSCLPGPSGSRDFLAAAPDIQARNRCGILCRSRYCSQAVASIWVHVLAGRPRTFEALCGNASFPVPCRHQARFWETQGV